MPWFRFREPFSGPTWTVVKQKLQVTIVERGSLESAVNSDIICRVKAGAKGSTIASTIKWVIDDGTKVSVGDLLVELDDSGFQEQLKDRRNTVNSAYAQLVGAKTNLIIVESQNLSDLKTAEVAKNLADVDLDKFVGLTAGDKILAFDKHDDVVHYLAKGFADDVSKEQESAGGKLTSEYLQALKDIEGRREMARSDLLLWLDRAAWSLGMVDKGYYTRSQAEADQSRKASADISLKKVQGEYDVYRRFILERTVTDLWGKAKEADRKLATVLRQAEPKMEKARADEKSLKAIYDQEDDRLKELAKEEKYYKIKSPQDGMVVYYVPEQSRSGSGSQQSVIAQGEPVREGQKLIRIPNLQKMVVNTRVHEAMVSKVKGEETAPTGYSDRLRASFSLRGHDLFELISYHAVLDKMLRDDYKDDFKDKDLRITFPGHEARIRIDAFPGKQYKGRVKSKATLAAATEFFSSDVKVYQTMVTIEDQDDRPLQPGMSAEVTILADELKEPVLVIPIQAVVGNVAMGEHRKCYVLDGSGFPQERDIVVGKSNDKLVEVREGLKEGDIIVMSPKALIPEKSDMRPGTPGPQRGAIFDPSGGGDKKGDAKKDAKKGKR